MTLISIIIPVHESEDIEKLNNTLNGITKTIGLKIDDYSIMLIGKLPTDYYFQDYNMRDYVDSDQPLGTSKNQGADYAIEKYKPDVLVFMDGHINFFEKESNNWGRVIIYYLSQHSDHIVSPIVSIYENSNSPGHGLRVFFKDSGEIDIKWVRSPPNNQPFEVPALCGCFMAMTQKTYQDSIFGFTPYKGREDLEFSLRMWTFGKHSISIPNLTIGHLWKKSISYDDKQWVEWGASNLLYTFLNFDDMIYTYKIFGALQIPAQYKPKIWMTVLTPYWWNIKNQIKNRRVKPTEEYFKTFANS